MALPKYGMAGAANSFSQNTEAQFASYYDAFTEYKHKLSVLKTLASEDYLRGAYGIAASTDAGANTFGLVIQSVTYTESEVAGPVEAKCTTKFNVTGGALPVADDKLTYTDYLAILGRSYTMQINCMGTLSSDFELNKVGAHKTGEWRVACATDAGIYVAITDPDVIRVGESSALTAYNSCTITLEKFVARTDLENIDQPIIELTNLTGAIIAAAAGDATPYAVRSLTKSGSMGPTGVWTLSENVTIYDTNPSESAAFGG